MEAIWSFGWSLAQPHRSFLSWLVPQGGLSRLSLPALQGKHRADAVSPEREYLRRKLEAQLHDTHSCLQRHLGSHWQGDGRTFVKDIQSWESGETLVRQ